MPPFRRPLLLISIYPCPCVIEPPRAAKPFRCRSTGLEPMAQPPGSDIFTWPHLASSGPATRKDARILLTSSYGAVVLRSELQLITSRVLSSENSVEAPSESTSSHIIFTSFRYGTSSMTHLPSASRDAAIIGSTEFFAPLMRTLPFSGLAPSIISLDTSLSPLPSFVSRSLRAGAAC